MKIKKYRNQAHAERVRIEACQCAAQVLASRDDERVMPIGWSLAVFFEKYITSGAEGTLKEFGPKKPAKLKAVK
jgi:peroxiredoxin family protein